MKNQGTLENLASNKDIFLSLGSNLNSHYGSKIQNLKIAQLLMLSRNINIIKRSSYYETLAYPNKEDPKFINCVIKVHTKLSPIELINALLKIEKLLGRTRKKKMNLEFVI